MQTKTLNTEVLNNSTPAVINTITAPPVSQQQLQQQPQQQEHQQQQFNTSLSSSQQLQQDSASLIVFICSQDGSLAPPVPPRLVLQAQSLVHDLSNSGKQALSFTKH
ncbi:hypothetical protein O3M35_000300 [Rhynocoris fuscipes]|uniref:Uncharacterized protein n=1 Tax=Rhynocoris fuscipes TaxID=488301 RepID=A0AAW1DL11_9HEMI